MKTAFSMLSYYFICPTARHKCVNNTTINKNCPCTDFCGYGPTCEITDSHPILENKNLLDNDD